MKYRYDDNGNKFVVYEKCQFAYCMLRDKFDSILSSTYGHAPAFLNGIECRLFVVKEDGTHLSRYYMYYYNDHYYAFLGRTNRHVYAKYIHPKNVRQLDYDKLFE